MDVIQRRGKKEGFSTSNRSLSSRPIPTTPARFLRLFERAGRSLFPASGTTDIKTFQVSRAGNFRFHKIYMESEPASTNKFSFNHDREKEKR